MLAAEDDNSDLTDKTGICYEFNFYNFQDLLLRKLFDLDAYFTFKLVLLLNC